MLLASGLAQGEPTAPQQKGSAVTPAAQTKSADAVKPKPVPASKPAPAVKSAPVAKVKRVEPVAAVVVFREPTKTQKLAALLESYKANEITPTQYHEDRAALIARK